MHACDLGGRGRIRRLGLILLAMVSCAARLTGQTVPKSAISRATVGQPVEIAIESATEALVPGRTTALVLRLKPDPGWHTYWRYAGDVGSPPSVVWRVPDGVEVGALRWPTPELIKAPPLASYGYEREVRLISDLRVPADAKPGTTVELRGDVTWVACKIECIAGDVLLTLSLPVASSSATNAIVAAAVERESARRPRASSGWQFRAFVDSLDLGLVVLPPDGVALPAGDIQFFVDSAGLIEHAAPVRRQPLGDELELRMQRSAFSVGVPRLVRGVLVSGNWAIEVEAPVRSEAALAVGARPIEPTNLIALGVSAVLALLGGTLLNVMPCVLPVLSIKTLRLADGATKGAAHGRREAWWFLAGVLVSMWSIVALLLVLRARGAELGWGFQLQDPAVVGVLVLVVFAAALNMMGVFEIAPVGGRLLAASDRGSQRVQAFAGGSLMVALATPCSAPFMATALAYGITHGALDAFVVFTALGVGFAWPYAVVAVSPSLRKMIPPLGAWMVTLRQLLAFPLLLTVVWLLWVQGRQTDGNATALQLGAMLLLAFGLWAWGHFTSVAASRARRWGVGVLTVVAGGTALLLTTSINAPAPSTETTNQPPNIGALAWMPYRDGLIESERAAGHMVMLDVTADWCLTCKVNDKVAFASDDVQKAIQHHRVALVRADWTKRDSVVTRLLLQLGRNSVPLVVLYPTDAAQVPRFLPTILTPGVVVRALDDAALSTLQPSRP